MEMDDVFGAGIGVNGDVAGMADEVCRLYLSRLRELLLDGEVGVKDMVSLGKVLLPLLEGVISSSSSVSRVRGGGGGVDLLKVINGGVGGE